MSQENLETLKRGIEAYNRRDAEAVLQDLDPDVEWYPALQVMFGGAATVYRGHAAVREMLREVDEAVAELHVDHSEIRDLGDRILAIGRINTRGKASGAVTASPLAFVADFANGKITRIRSYLDPKDALEAVGLSE